jgi:hypothetical protein
MEPNDSEQDEYLFTMREDPVLSLTALHQSEALHPSLGRFLDWHTLRGYMHLRFPEISKYIPLNRRETPEAFASTVGGWRVTFPPQGSGTG